LDVASDGFRRLENVLAQRYLGDITIAPVLTLEDVKRALSNPDMESVTRFIKRGEKAAWASKFNENFCIKR
jgi:hypothetical protein